MKRKSGTQGMILVEGLTNKAPQKKPFFFSSFFEWRSLFALSHGSPRWCCIMSAPAQPPSTVISRENIKVAAETVGVELTEDVVKTLCHEVEYRVREILQVRSSLI